MKTKEQANNNDVDLVNARIHGRLVPDLDGACEQARVSRLLLNSAALWHFVNRMTADERAEVLGEYVKVMARPEHGDGGRKRR